MADSVKLQDVAALRAATAVNNLNASTKAAKAGESAMSFGNALNKASERAESGNTKADPSKSGINTADDRKDIGKDTGRDAKGSVDRLKSSDKGTGNVKDSAGSDKAVKEAAEAVKEEIGEALEVTEEEIANAMEILGLTLTDLLKPENIGSLTAALKEIDISEVVSDEAIYADVQGILDVQRNVVSDLLQTLDMTPEEFKNALDTDVFNVGADFPAVETGEDEAIADRPENTEGFQNILRESVQTEGASEEAAAGTPAETVNTSNTAREPDGQPERSVEVIVENAPDTTKGTVEIPLDDNDRGNGRDFNSQGERQEMFSQNVPGVTVSQNPVNEFMDNLTEAVSETTSEFLNSYERVQDIVNQVRDQIRISVNQETTTMEMQLNPESLGKVGLHIESKAGNITAQFIAQDEGVRAALETQVAELKRNLEDQGIKIESVEVTLASREFESDFLNGREGQNGDNPTEEEAERSARLRRINLGTAGIGDIPEEEMTDEEILNRRMMRENGSQVDFSA